jgi:hypothetical protein
VVNGSARGAGEGLGDGVALVRVPRGNWLGARDVGGQTIATLKTVKDFRNGTLRSSPASLALAKVETNMTVVPFSPLRTAPPASIACLNVSQRGEV